MGGVITKLLLKGVLEWFFVEKNTTQGRTSITIGQWHTVEVLESGTVIMETKDGAYRPLESDEIMER